MGLLPLIPIGIAAGIGSSLIRGQRRQQEMEQRAKLKAEEFSNEAVVRSALSMAEKGDPSGIENPAFAKAAGPDVAQYIASVLASRGRQAGQAETRRSTEAESMYGYDPQGGPQRSSSVIANEPAVGEPAPRAPQRPPAPTGPPPVAPGTEPEAAATPQTGINRLQGTLAEGQSVSGEAGGLKFTVTGNLMAQRRAAVQRIIKDNVPYDDAVSQYVAQTGDLTGLDGFKQIGHGQFMQEYRGAIADSGLRLSELSVDQRRQFAEQAFLTVGYIPDALKDSLKFTREDEARLAYTRATKLMNEKGMTFPQALAVLERGGFKLDKDDEVVLGQRYFGEVLTELQKRAGESANIEALIKQAAIAVNNNPRYVPPDYRDAIREKTPADEKTRARQAEKGEPIPRLSDTGVGPAAAPAPAAPTSGAPSRAPAAGGGGAGTGVPTTRPSAGTGPAAARAEVEQRETDLAAQRAGAVKQAQENVLERMSPKERDDYNAIVDSQKLGRRIRVSFNPAWVGPAKGRIDDLKEKFVGLPPEESAFRADLQQFINDAIFQITGKQVGSVTEATRIMGPMPNVNLPPVVFQARIKALLDRLQMKHDTFVETTRTQGLRTPASAPKMGDGEMGAIEDKLRKQYPRPGTR